MQQGTERERRRGWPGSSDGNRNRAQTGVTGNAHRNDEEVEAETGREADGDGQEVERMEMGIAEDENIYSWMYFFYSHPHLNSMAKE